jgi:chromosome segregation ATPase
MDRLRQINARLDSISSSVGLTAPQIAAAAAGPSTQPVALASAIGQADLERSMAEFDQDLAAARIALKDHPEFQAYVDAATEMEKRTRELTTKLIQRRQDWQEQLTSLTRLMDDETARRQDALYNADDKLKSLNAELNSWEHKLSAATDEGLGDDQIQRCKSKIDDLTKQVAQREDELGVDDPYHKLRDQVNQLIKSGQDQLAEDRKAIDQAMVDFQSKLDVSPDATGLTDAQRQAAESLRLRAKQLAEARRNYTKAAAASALAAAGSGTTSDGSAIAAAAKVSPAIDPANGGVTKVIDVAPNQGATATLAQATQPDAAALKSELATLRVTIQEEDNQIKLAQADLDSKQDAVKAASTGATGVITEAQNRMDTCMTTLNNLKNSRTSLEREVASKFDVVMPIKDDVKTTEENPRLMYIVAACAILLLGFSGVITLVSHRSSSQPTDMGPGGPPSNPQNPNGPPAKNLLPADPFGNPVA